MCSWHWWVLSSMAVARKSCFFVDMCKTVASLSIQYASYRFQTHPFYRYIQELSTCHWAHATNEHWAMDWNRDTSPRGWELDHLQIESSPVFTAASYHYSLCTARNELHQSIRWEEGNESTIWETVGTDACAGSGGEAPSQQCEIILHICCIICAFHRWRNQLI